MVVIIRHLNTRSQEERVDWELLMLGDCCVTEKKLMRRVQVQRSKRGGVGNKNRRSRVRSHCCATETLVSGKGKECETSCVSSDE
jgi:hypothetical protein